VHEVDLLAIDLRRVLRVGVQPRFLGAPVVIVAPVGGEFAQVADRHAAFPSGHGQVRRPARPAEALSQVVQVSLCDADPELLDVVRGGAVHGLVLQGWQLI
jgi:hypothetical protein